MISNRQYHRLIEAKKKGNTVTDCAMKADVDRKTARKYLKARKMPAELQAKRDWRTREDPLEPVWPSAVEFLKAAPELEAKALFEELLLKFPGKLLPVHLRTFQRRVRTWRFKHGPDQEVIFPQDREPGRSMELDWTHGSALGVTIQGKLFNHLLCHCVLPFSNWQWAEICQSESLLSLKQGLQAALRQLGKAPLELQTDNSSAATHWIGSGGERTFNSEYSKVVEHFGMKPVTINIGCPNENGDVESGNGHLKNRIKQQLLLRGSSDFECESAYAAFVHEVVRKANAARENALRMELEQMRELPGAWLPCYEEVYCTVHRSSTIRVKKRGYSVPSRLIGCDLKAEVYEWEIKLYLGADLVMQMPRQKGQGRTVDFRHVIESLLRKPGAFAGYRYREDLFVSPVYRQAYDQLIVEHGQRRGELEYLRLLKLAAETSQEQVEKALMERKANWSLDGLRRQLKPSESLQDCLPEPVISLDSYDLLLTGKEAEHAA